MLKNFTSPGRIEKKITAAPSVWDRYFTMPIPQFLAAAGIGRTTCYKLIAEGQIETVLVGRRRLVVVSSWQRLIERNRAAGGEGRAQP